jgi:hypothetical protein
MLKKYGESVSIESVSTRYFGIIFEAIDEFGIQIL